MSSLAKTRLWEKARQMAESVPTPVLVMDAEMMRDLYQDFRVNFPHAGIYYALKANSDPAVVSLFHNMGAGFEVGSEGALRLLSDIGVPASKVVSGNPLKTPAFIEMAYSMGIRRFTFDSFTEVDKMSRLAPGAEVYVRLAVVNSYSEWPLDKKFGADPQMAPDLLSAAADQGLRPVGLAFHVGSQCTNVAGWQEALEMSSRVWRQAADRGIILSSINLGGGFPSEYTRPVPQLHDIASAIDEGLRDHFPASIDTLLEPGRALVGDAGIMITTVIAKASREGKEWVYLDAGIFNGLMEAVGGIRYPLRVLKTGRATKQVVAGPSCDSMDVLPGETDLPDLEVGDKVFIMTAGAYTTAYASSFDGIAVPKVMLV